MEIERKFLVKELPKDLEKYPHKLYVQGYLSVDPVLRVRREGDSYVVTYKGRGLMVREEYNLPLTGEAFAHLLTKADGMIIQKTRYFIPDGNGYTIELDVFEKELEPLVLAEVEFEDVKKAKAYVPPAWFGRDVTNDSVYHNSSLSRNGLPSSICQTAGSPEKLSKNR